MNSFSQNIPSDEGTAAFFQDLRHSWEPEKSFWALGCSTVPSFVQLYFWQGELAWTSAILCPRHLQRPPVCFFQRFFSCAVEKLYSKGEEGGGKKKEKHLSDLVHKIVSIAVTLIRAQNNVIFPGRTPCPFLNSFLWWTMLPAPPFLLTTRWFLWT